MTQLDSLMAKLDAGVLDRLGDPAIYRTAAAPLVDITLNVFADLSDSVESIMGGGVVTGDVAVSVRVSDVAQPARGDTIVLPRRQYIRRVDSWRLDPGGFWWILQTSRAA